MTRIQNDKMLNNVINSVTAAVDQEKTVGGRFSRRRYGTVTKRQDIKEETAMNIIAAVDKHWAIGNRGKLLVTIPDDQKLFREETKGKVIVMGRKTLESLPAGQPLAGRKNVVLTRDEAYKVKGCEIFHNLKDAMEFLKQFKSEDIYIIGGAEIYEAFLPYCDTAHITWIDYEYMADTWLPNLDKDPDWEVTADSDEQTYFDLCYEFRRYERTGKKALELGANAVIDPTKVDVAEEVKRLTDGLGAKIVFNTTAIPAIALQALDCTAKCGTMVMFSSLHPNKPVEINLGAIHSTQKNITGAQNGTVKTFWQAVKMLNRGVFDPTPIIEDVYDYHDFDQAMACAMRPDTYKVVLKITD